MQLWDLSGLEISSLYNGNNYYFVYVSKIKTASTAFLVYDDLIGRLI